MHFNQDIQRISTSHEVLIDAINGRPRDGERKHLTPVGQGDAPDLLELFKDLWYGDAICYITVLGGKEKFDWLMC